MQAVCAPAFIVVAFIAPFLCLAEIHITTSRDDARDLREHGSLTLECRSTDHHADWTHNGQPVSNTTGRFHIAEEKTSAGGVVSRLTIVSAEPEDAGTYVCACPHSNTADRINVTVVGHEHHSQTMIDGPNKVEKALGSQLQLTCKADIHSSVEWLLNGVRLTESTKDSISTKEDAHSHQKTVMLVRKSLAAQDFGVYSCRNVGDSKDEARVTVTNTSSPSSAGGFRRYAMETTGLAIMVVLGKIAMAL